MLIEVGKKYIDAIGKVIKIVKYNGTNFMSKSNVTYYMNGQFFRSDKSDLDLICLVDENLLKQYEANEITQKEFIAKHIELYTGEKKNCDTCINGINISNLLEESKLRIINICNNCLCLSNWETK
ncbi:MAG: hypothetical protein RBR93_12220 [Aliarcobacter butzleri]|nr:hypothetical protein [Aliarcobacter butzleri]